MSPCSTQRSKRQQIGVLRFEVSQLAEMPSRSQKTLFHHFHESRKEPRRPQETLPGALGLVFVNAPVEKRKQAMRGPSVVDAEQCDRISRKDYPAVAEAGDFRIAQAGEEASRPARSAPDCLRAFDDTTNSAQIGSCDQQDDSSAWVRESRSPSDCSFADRVTTRSMMSNTRPR